MGNVKINFKDFKMFTDISQRNTELVDVRMDISDMLYKRLNGVMPHDIALRIYHSEGPVEFNENEIALIKDFSSSLTPIFYDSLIANIEE